MNECQTNNGGCHRERACTNTPGSRKCGDCSSGWMNDGSTGCTGLYWFAGILTIQVSKILLPLNTYTLNCVCRRERVPDKQWRVRQQAHMRKHTGWAHMRRLSIWLDKPWSHGLHRSVLVEISVKCMCFRRCDCAISKHEHAIMRLDVNECVANNGGCDTRRTCTNMPGSRSCGECAAGWTNNGTTGCTGLRLCICRCLSNCCSFSGVRDFLDVNSFALRC